MSKLARDNRNADLGKIHIAKKQLSMSDADYEAMLWTQGRVRSAKDLDFAGRRAVLDYLRSIGFRPVAAKKSARPKRPTPSVDALPLVRRIRAQLISLDRKPDEYADGIAKQMLGDAAPEFFEWCHPRDLHKISQALGVEQNRRGAPTA
jgi:phage gp16-like protein